MLTYRLDGEKGDMMTNYFDSNIGNFQKAAEFINRECVSFAGRSIRSVASPWVFMTFSRVFSFIEDDAEYIDFECENIQNIPCIATVNVTGDVVIANKSDLKEI